MARFNSVPPSIDTALGNLTERLTILLPNLTSGTGKNITVDSRRYLYMYKSDPNNLYLSEQRLTGSEPGIKAFCIVHWDSSGIQVYDTSHIKSGHDMVVQLIQDLGSEGIFEAITKSYSLNALLGLGYIDSELITDTIRITAQAQRSRLLQAEVMVLEGVDPNTMPELQLNQAVNMVKAPGYLRSAEAPKLVSIQAATPASAPQSEHDTTDPDAYTAESISKSAPILPSPFASQATVDIAPKVDATVPKGWANVDYVEDALPASELTVEALQAKLAATSVKVARK